MGLFHSLIGRPLDQQRRAPALARLAAAVRPAVLYAVGDIHGCLSQLLALEAGIVADAAGVEGEKWIVYLGDYVDRGPQSAQVLDHLISPPPSGLRRFCLRGNHEAMMLDALRQAGAIELWLANGGVETMRSYGMATSEVGQLRGGRNRTQSLRAHVPEEHIAFLEGLPVALTVPGYLFVHAGVRPGVPLERQSDDDLMWIRGDFVHVDHDHGFVVVHGHTPVAEPTVRPYRIGVDTGCYETGRLTALRLTEDGAVGFLQT